MSDSKIKFCGGAGSVTGANFLFTHNGFKVLVDCGIQQGSEEQQKWNWQDFPYEPSEIDVLLVTHAHADHIGRIPKLVADGFRGQIYSTAVTRELAEVMLPDAQGLSEKQAKKWGMKPLYSEAAVSNSFLNWQTKLYHQPFTIGGGITVNMKDAGHVLGSSMYELTFEGSDKKVVFTGDLGNTPAPLLRDTESIEDANFMVMESVYGDRNHEHKEERTAKLKAILGRTLEREGTVVIPAFSIERTQQMLFEINNFVESGDIPSVPVYLDSPLAIKVTEIYERHQELFNKDRRDDIAQGDDIFDFPNLYFTDTRERSKKINGAKGPKIIIAGSGMSAGGRVLHHERLYLPDSKNMVILVGYQAVGSVGRQLLDGHKKVIIFNEEVSVKAEIESVLGYSAHKQSDDLVRFVESTAGSLEKVFVCMGEPKSSLFLAQRLRDYLDVPAVVPVENDEVKLDL